MHIIIPDGDPVADLRALEAKRERGEISEATYNATFTALDAMTAKYLCENNDGRKAFQVVRGKNLCAVCATIAISKRKRGQL